MKTIKAKVHRLPTDGKTQIHGIRGQGLGFTTSPRPSGIKDVDRPAVIGGVYEGGYHLYFTTDEEIKVEGWHLFSAFKGLANAAHGNMSIELAYCKSYNRSDDKFLFIHPNGEKRTEHPSKSKGVYKKIIATTDPKLIADGVAEIEQSFIEEYCKAGGIDEVLVGYKFNCKDPSDVCSVMCKEECVHPEYILKLNPDNTIIIHPVKEKMYNLTYKQLWSLFTHAQSWGYEHAMKDHVWQWKENEKGNQSIPKELNKWIEENL